MLDLLPVDDIRWQLAILAATLLAVAVGLKILQLVVRYVRGMRPTQLHPKLQRYAGDDDPSVRRRRVLAIQILATSSSNEVPGFNVVRALDAVYVDGLRNPTEALEAIKAAAAEMGGNAVINIRQDRNPRGKCSAAGDVVLIESPQPDDVDQATQEDSDE